MVNFGKYLASNNTLSSSSWFGQNAEKVVDEFFTHLPALPDKFDDQFLIPNIGSSNDKLSSPSFTYTTLTSGTAAPSHNAIKYIRSHDGGVMIAGRCWYKDTFGNVYRTDFCFMTLMSGAVSTCSTHNEIH